MVHFSKTNHFWYLFVKFPPGCTYTVSISICWTLAIPTKKRLATSFRDCHYIYIIRIAQPPNPLVFKYSRGIVQLPNSLTDLAKGPMTKIAKRFQKARNSRLRCPKTSAMKNMGCLTGNPRKWDIINFIKGSIYKPLDTLNKEVLFIAQVSQTTNMKKNTTELHQWQAGWLTRRN